MFIHIADAFHGEKKRAMRKTFPLIYINNIMQSVSHMQGKQIKF